MASSIRKAFPNAAGVITLSGVNPSSAIATARAPVASACRSLSAWTAGMAAPPGSIMPRASAVRAMVEAVPITMQVPAVGIRRPPTVSMVSASIPPARWRAHSLRQSVQAPRRSPLKCPVIIGPVTSRTAGLPALAAPMSRAGTVLSQPPISTTASMGWARMSSSVSIAIRLRRNIEVGWVKLSWIDMVGKRTGRPPASMTPRSMAAIRSGTVRWQPL